MLIKSTKTRINKESEERTMNRNSNRMSTGMALLCTLGILLFIGWMIDLGTPKCIKSGCDNDATFNLFTFALFTPL